MSIESIQGAAGAPVFALARKQAGAQEEAAAAESVAQAQDNAAQAQTAQTTEGVKTEGVKEVEKTELPTAADLKADQNRAILEATMQVSIDSGNDSLALMLKAAIEGINKELEPMFGENAIQNAMDQDNSPEGTAGRIVSLSTAFFDAYARQHPDEDPEKLVNGFMETIQRGFEKGYGEATDILKGLNVFDGDVKSGIEKTYELVKKGYEEFAQSKIEELKKAQGGDANEVEAAADSPAPGIGEGKDTSTDATRA